MDANRTQSERGRASMKSFQRKMDGIAMAFEKDLDPSSQRWPGKRPWQGWPGHGKDGLGLEKGIG